MTCAERLVLSDAGAEVIVDGAPDCEKIAEAYIDALMEHGGVAITNSTGFYQGSLKQFKRFAKTDIAELF